MKVIDGERVGIGIADMRPTTLILSPNFIGANRLNLVEDVLLAGHPDRDHQDERGGSDDHAQRSENEAHLIAAKGVVGEGDDLAKGHLRPKALGDESGGHQSLDYGWRRQGARLRVGACRT